MTVSEIRQTIIGRLTPVVGDREAHAMASLILETQLGLTAVDIAVNPSRELTAESAAAIDVITRRVEQGEPLQYILGVAPFHGLDIAVVSGVLIPRPETSELVDIVVDMAGDRTDLRVLDVCTGSGCIAVALGRSLRFPEVTAVDIDDTAIATARLNAKRLNVDMAVEKRDVLTDALPAGPFDIIVSNPPYVDESEKSAIDPRVLDHEPALALFVPDDDPLRFYRAIGRAALDSLASGGTLFFEINPRHIDAMKRLMTGLGYTDVEARRDYNGKYRFIIARK